VGAKKGAPMKTSKTKMLILALALPVSLTACVTTGQGGPSVAASEVGRMKQAWPAKVVAVRRVALENDGAWVGKTAGAVVGAIGGSALGGGTGRYVGAVAGAVAGGFVGDAAEKGATRSDAVELTLSVADGTTRVITQRDDGTEFSKGDAVRIVGPTPYRVVR
jgi:outer membrane lipoprotein SlyB